MNRLLAALLALVLAGPVMAHDGPLSVLFIAGQDTHGWGAHDHNPSSAVLSEALKDAMGDSVQIKVVWSKWPTKEELAKADVCVVYSDGWNRSVVKGEERLNQIENFMSAGKGVLRIHWATGSDPSENERHRRLFGGNMESDYSVHSTIWNQKFSLAKHPITNGMKPFELFDECYFYMHWVDEARTGVTDILSAKPGPDFKAGSITPASRKSLQNGDSQAVAWAYERPEGGRAFSFTGGHFHWDWANDNSRKMVLNAIVWASRHEVPSGGLNSKRPTAERLLSVMKERGHKKNPAWTAEALQPLLEQMNQPGGKIDWRRPPIKK
ncbi:MAG: ThuA domain-containing protein [Planctomycetota bacterium]